MQRFLLWTAPGIFVLLWSTGFIGARLGLPHAEPFTFLFVRFGIVSVLLVSITAFTIKKWPERRLLAHSIVVGVLMQGVYLGGVFFAIDRGMPVGISALIVSLQPIITLLLVAVFLGEKVSGLTIGLFMVALVGVGLVLGPNIDGSQVVMLAPSSIVASIIAVLGISIGTVYQKRLAGHIDLLAGLCGQYFGATILLGVLAISTETMQIEWNGEFLFALFWLVFILSFGAVGLLIFLINRDSVAKISALFFLVPAITMVFANLMFAETMTLVQIAGLVIACGAVAIVMMKNQ